MEQVQLGAIEDGLREGARVDLATLRDSVAGSGWAVVASAAQGMCVAGGPCQHVTSHGGLPMRSCKRKGPGPPAPTWRSVRKAIRSDLKAASLHSGSGGRELLRREWVMEAGHFGVS